MKPRQYGGPEPSPRPQDAPTYEKSSGVASRDRGFPRPTGPRRRSNPQPSWLDRLNSAVRNKARDITDEYRNRPVVDDSQYNKNLTDFLSMAQQILSSSSAENSSRYSSQENALRSNAADISGKIGGGYNALSAFISGQAPKIQEGYQAGIQGTSEATNRAQTSITEGTAAAQAQQQAIMNRLGIADANIPIANAGTTLESGMANRVADVAQRGQGAENLLNAFMGSGLDYNAAMGTSARLEGQGQQDRISRDLASRLAEIADARAASQSSSTSDAYSLAQDLMNSDYQQWAGNYERRSARDQTAYERAMNMQATPELNSTSYGALGPAGQAQYALQQYGVDERDAGEIISAMNEAYSSGDANNAASFIQKMQQIAAERGLDPISTANAAAIYYKFFPQ